MKSLLISFATAVELLKLVIERSCSLVLLEATGPLLSGLTASTLMPRLVVVFVAPTPPSSSVVVVIIVLVTLILIFIFLGGSASTVGVCYSASALGA